MISLILPGCIFSQVESYYLGEKLIERVCHQKIKEIKGEMYKYANGKMESNSKEVFLYGFDEKGNLIRKQMYSLRKNKIIANYEYKYDDVNVLIEETEYDASGSASLKCKYRYNSQGNLIERTKLKLNGKLSSTVLYKYNSDDQLIGEEWYSKNGTIYEDKKYNYNLGGKLSEEIHYDNNGVVNTHYLYNFNELNLLSEKRSLYTDGNIYEKWVYEYDDDGKLAKEFHYFSDLKPEYFIEFIYDDLKNVNEFNLYTETGKISKTFKYIYTYY